MSAKKLTLMSVLLGTALIIFVIEAQLPPIAPIPGIKLGLANIITVISLYILGRKEAFVIMTLRIILGCIFAGSFTSFLYSISGGLVSFLFISLISCFIDERRLWITSIFGSIGHNIGQICAAVLITKTPYIIWYLPILIISAVLSGAFTGTAAQVTLNRLRKTILKEKHDA